MQLIRSVRWYLRPPAVVKNPRVLFYFISRCTTIRSNMSRSIPLLSFVLAVAAVTVQACNVPSQYTDLAAKVRGVCLAETGISEDVIDGTCSGNFPDDGNLKCYMKCIVTQLDMLRGDGSINYDLVISMIPAASKDRLTAAVNSCRDESGSDLCDRVFNIVKCIYKNDAEDFFMP